jgi:hypothetical protein
MEDTQDTSRYYGTTSTHCYDEADTGIFTSPSLPQLTVWATNPHNDATLNFLGDTYFSDSNDRDQFRGEITCTYTQTDGSESTTTSPIGNSYAPLIGRDQFSTLELGIRFSFGAYHYVGPDYDQSVPTAEGLQIISMEIRDGSTLSDSIDKQFNDTPQGDVQHKLTFDTKLGFWFV